MKLSEVVIVMGSESDFKVMRDALNLLKAWKIKVHAEVVSAHRTPKLLATKVQEWEKNNVKVIIAGAGGAAHLPGMLASFSILPVIGVPVKSKAMDGLDSLLSIAQMPAGVPVATVGVNGAKNAALLAVKILSLESTNLKTKLNAYKKKMQKDVQKMQKNVRKLSR